MYVNYFRASVLISNSPTRVAAAWGQRYIVVVDPGTLLNFFFCNESSWLVPGTYKE